MSWGWDKYALEQWVFGSTGYSALQQPCSIIQSLLRGKHQPEAGCGRSASPVRREDATCLPSKTL